MFCKKKTKYTYDPLLGLNSMEIYIEINRSADMCDIFEDITNCVISIQAIADNIIALSDFFKYCLNCTSS